MKTVLKYSSSRSLCASCPSFASSGTALRRTPGVEVQRSTAPSSSRPKQAMRLIRPRQSAGGVRCSTNGPGTSTGVSAGTIRTDTTDNAATKMAPKIFCFGVLKILLRGDVCLLVRLHCQRRSLSPNAAECHCGNLMENAEFLRLRDRFDTNIVVPLERL